MDILKMKILNPIGSEEQLLDCFFGIPALRRAATDKKIACVSRHINKVRRINGKRFSSLMSRVVISTTISTNLLKQNITIRSSMPR